jgi:hypothetical protein
VVEAGPLGVQIRGGANRQDGNPGKICSLVISPMLLHWRFVACLLKGLLPPGQFFHGNTNPRLPTQPSLAWEERQPRRVFGLADPWLRGER